MSFGTPPTLEEQKEAFAAQVADSLKTNFSNMYNPYDVIKSLRKLIVRYYGLDGLNGLDKDLYDELILAGFDQLCQSNILPALAMNRDKVVGDNAY